MGPTTDPQALKKYIDSLIADAQKALAEDKLDAAYGCLVPAMKLAKDGGQKQTIRTLASNVETKAGEWIKKADADVAAGKFKAAIARYRMVAGMTQLKVGAEATSKLASAEADPRLKAEVAEQKALALFAPTHALIHLVEDKVPDADCIPDSEDVAIDTPLTLKMKGPDRLRVLDTIATLLKTYPDTAAGKWAVAVQEKLEADKTFMAAVAAQRADDAARQDFQTALMYGKNRQFDKAEELLNKVIKAYPTTEWAAKARTELGKPDYASK